MHTRSSRTPLLLPHRFKSAKFAGAVLAEQLGKRAGRPAGFWAAAAHARASDAGRRRRQLAHRGCCRLDWLPICLPASVQARGCLPRAPGRAGAPGPVPPTASPCGGPRCCRSSAVGSVGQSADRPAAGGKASCGFGTPPCRLWPRLLAQAANPTHLAARTPIRGRWRDERVLWHDTAGGDRRQRAGAAAMRSLLLQGRLLPSAAPQSCHP